MCVWEGAVVQDEFQHIIIHVTISGVGQALNSSSFVTSARLTQNGKVRLEKVPCHVLLAVIGKSFARRGSDNHDVTVPHDCRCFCNRLCVLLPTYLWVMPLSNQRTLDHFLIFRCHFSTAYHLSPSILEATVNPPSAGSHCYHLFPQLFN